jgi:ADP-heptose:LPS heptosyltransferase
LNVLLFRAGALGDLLLLRPAVAALRRAGHRVRLLAPERPGSVLCGPGAADAVLASDGPELALALAQGFGDGPIAHALTDADAVVAYTRSAPLLERLAERARRLIVHDPTPPASGPHAARWFAQAIAPLVGASATDSPIPADGGVLAFSDAEQREAEARTRALPRGFLAVHPGSGSPAKNWPLERFLEAARRLADGAAWLLVAGPAEEALVAPRGATLAREWPPRVLGAALARAGLVLGNDSGVSHLAAAAGAPTLALFGPTDPALWAPVGPRVATLRAPGATIVEIGLDAVVEAGRRLRSAASGLPSG